MLQDWTMQTSSPTTLAKTLRWQMKSFNAALTPFKINVKSHLFAVTLGHRPHGLRNTRISNKTLGNLLRKITSREINALDFVV